MKYSDNTVKVCGNFKLYMYIESMCVIPLYFYKNHGKTLPLKSNEALDVIVRNIVFLKLVDAVSSKTF